MSANKNALVALVRPAKTVGMLSMMVRCRTFGRDMNGLSVVPNEVRHLIMGGTVLGTRRGGPATPRLMSHRQYCSESHSDGNAERVGARAGRRSYKHGDKSEARVATNQLSVTLETMAEPPAKAARHASPLDVRLTSYRTRIVSLLTHTG